MAAGRAGSRMQSSSLSFLIPFSGDSLLSSLSLPALPAACSQLCYSQKGSRSGSTLPAWCSFLTCLWPLSTTDSFSQKLLEMKALAFPLLASHPHFLYCKTNRQNKTHCYISKYRWFGGCSRHLHILDSALKLKRRCWAPDTIPRCLLIRSLWCSLSWTFQLFPLRGKRK